MIKKVPVGQREGLRLEFKSARALEKPDTIAREVVSMLNAEGGEVWIGLAETDGIATREEDVPDAERARIGLLNSLLEKIDPEPRHELDLQVVPGQSVRNLLCIDVKPDEHRAPYALRGESLLFLTRVDHRVRAMTRDEVFGGQTGDEPDARAIEVLHVRREAVLRRRESRFWIAIQPSPPAALDLQALKDPLSELLVDPTRAGNRRSGWTYGPSRERPTFNGKAEPATCWEVSDWAGRKVSIASDGCVELSVPLKTIENHQEPGSREIHPLGLLEYVVSAARLARAVHTVVGIPIERFLVDFALTGSSGWTIPQYAPGTYGHKFHRDMLPSLAVDDIVVPRARMSFTGEELADHADRIGYRVVREIFERFGLTEDRIPSAYDRSQERLVLTD